MRALETKLFEHVARSRVRLMMPCEKRADAKSFERVRDDGPGRFFTEPLVPMCHANVKPNLLDLFLWFVRTQTGAAHEIFVREQEYRPILNAVRGLQSNFPLETRSHLTF